MEKKRISLGVVITSVTAPATIKKVAEDHKINPQEVFVRVGFNYKGEAYSASNQLRFFGEDGYQKLLAAKATGEEVQITITANDKGTLMYLESTEKVEVKDLFTTPVAKEDKRKDVSSLF